MVPGNYSTHAIEDLMEMMNVLEGAHPKFAKDKKTHLLVKRLLETGEKFLLPEGGRLIDYDAGAEGLENLRLPFPIVVIEYPVSLSDEGKGSEDTGGGEVSSKRIIIAHDFEKANGKKSLAVYVLGYIDRWKAWAMGPAILVYEYGSVIEMVSLDEAPSGSMNKGVRERLVDDMKKRKSTKIPLFRCQVLIGCPRTFDKLREKNGWSEEKMEQELLWEMTGDLGIIVELANVLNCSNVETVSTFPSEALNKKRKKKGKIPFFSFRVLTIKPGKTVIRNSRGELEERRVSPRQHLRRGHIRRLDSEHYKEKRGQRIWIQPQLIGDLGKGVVEKDYRVERMAYFG